ncbi:unnamed protein product [Effrenium voratum]|nr:unnamed protein product [Effrenium voratum]
MTSAPFVALQVVTRLQLILLAQSLGSRMDAARSKLELLVGTALELKNCALMRDVVKIIQETLKWNEAPGAATFQRTRVFPVGKQLERLNTLKPTGDLLPKRRC